jgi:hypothetical protein
MVVTIWYRKYLSCHTHKKQATGRMNTNIFRFGSSIGVKGGVKVFARRVDGTFGATRCCPTWTSYPYCMGLCMFNVFITVKQAFATGTP